jgi:hypothetical protein
MMARITLALVFLGALDRAADACAMKDNEIAIVLGVVNGEVVSVRFALHEDDSATGTEWTGKATLRAGGVEHAIGTLDPKLNAGNEVDRLIAAARTEAVKLAGFVPAVRVSSKDCSDKPGAKCDGVVLEKAGTVLRAGTVRSQLALASEPDERNIVAVTRYTAGKTTIVVANVGNGDPRFAVDLRVCDGGCRSITTLHHGAQTDVVVITK